MSTLAGNKTILLLVHLSDRHFLQAPCSFTGRRFNPEERHGKSLTGVNSRNIDVGPPPPRLPLRSRARMQQTCARHRSLRSRTPFSRPLTGPSYTRARNAPSNPVISVLKKPSLVNGLITQSGQHNFRTLVSAAHLVGSPLPRRIPSSASDLMHRLSSVLA